jgi:hypothetical protein
MSGKKGVFICPSCQAVVKSDKPLHEGVICGECLHEFGNNSGSSEGKTQIPGGNWERGAGGVTRNLTGKKSAPILPVGVIDSPKMAVKTLEQARNESLGSPNDDETIMSDGSRRVRRRKKREKAEKNKGLMLFLGAWLCVVVAVLVIFTTGKFGTSKASKAPVETNGRNPMDQQIVDASRVKIEGEFQGFMKLPESNGQTQFIDRSADLSLAFSDYYRENPFPRALGKLTQTGVNVLRLPEDELAVESIWEDSEGHRWGALHILDKTTKSWKLDWENFAPYSTELWSKFVNQLGSKEGTFRLLVRKRRTADDKKKISVSFYRAPHVKESDGEFKRTESPEIDILAISDLAVEFERLWNDHQKENDPMGSILGRALDPDPQTYMRITVRLGWEAKKGDESHLVLKEIIGAGWFGERIIKLRQNAKDASAEELLEGLSESLGDE